MLSHSFIGVKDFATAMLFYSAVMRVLGHRLRFVDDARPWAGWQPADSDRPLFLIGAPENGQPASPGNGQMLALMCETRGMVDAAHAAGLAAGGQDAGAPGLRPMYHAQYYGAYLRDPEGNKIAFACHAAPDPA